MDEGVAGLCAASKSGLGYALMKSEGAFYMEKILCIVVVLAVIAIAMNYLYYVFEERLIRVRARCASKRMKRPSQRNAHIVVSLPAPFQICILSDLRRAGPSLGVPRMGFQ